MKFIARLSAGMLILASASSFADSGYSDMVVFGDSLSDPGNVFVLTEQVSVSPYEDGNIPTWPYPIGKGKTYSNGPTWAQVVAKELKLQGGTGPALRTTRFTNYAFGGASAADSASNPFDMTAQVSQFLGDNGSVADSDAIYAVWFGGNDVRHALEAAQMGGDPVAIIVDAVTNYYASNMVTLILAGATDFLIPNVPNLGVAPAITDLGPAASAGAMELSFLFNFVLDGVLDGIEGAFPDVNITRVDSFGLINAIVASPGTFGLGNAEDACTTPLVTAGAICKSPEEYLFWDGIHPSRAGHEVVAAAALEALP